MYWKKLLYEQFKKMYDSWDDSKPIQLIGLVKKEVKYILKLMEKGTKK